MTGEIELEGARGKSNWSVSFDCFKFLEAMLETVDFLEGDPNEDLPDQAEPQTRQE